MGKSKSFVDQKFVPARLVLQYTMYRSLGRTYFSAPVHSIIVTTPRYIRRPRFLQPYLGPGRVPEHEIFAHFKDFLNCSSSDLMSVGFGFSVSDFVVALKLVSTVIDALQKSGEARNGQRELLHQLYSLETALLQVKRLKLDESQHAELLALKQAAAQCQRTITDFWTKIEPYQKNLGPSASKSERVNDKLARIKWAFCKKEDIAKFKVDVASHAASIHLLLSTFQMGSIGIHNRKQNQQQRSLASEIQNSYLQYMQKLSTVSQGITNCLQLSKQLLEMMEKVVRTNILGFQVLFRLNDTIT